MKLTPLGPFTVTVYPVMGAPPSDDGAVNLTHTTVPDLRAIEVSSGAPGTVAAWVTVDVGAAKVTGDDASDAPESPAVFFANALTV